VLLAEPHAVDACPTTAAFARPLGDGDALLVRAELDRRLPGTRRKMTEVHLGVEASDQIPGPNRHTGLDGK
jgi:hypothetical protein